MNLYTRRVIGEETLSRTSAFSLLHSVVLSVMITSFISVLNGPLFGNIGS